MATSTHPFLLAPQRGSFRTAATSTASADKLFKGEPMATTMYFEETIRDQGGKASFDVELGRSSYYPEDSIYLTVDGKSVIMDRATAKRFVEAVVSVGSYHGFLE